MGAPTSAQPSPTVRAAGQAVAEFAIVLVPLLFVMFAVLDLGRGIYAYNAVAEAAREVARVTIVHPYSSGGTLGASTETESVIAEQRHVIPGLVASDVTITCVDLSDQPIASGSCRPGDFIKVSVRVSWSPASPLLYPLGIHEVSSVSRMELQ